MLFLFCKERAMSCQVTTTDRRKWLIMNIKPPLGHCDKDTCEHTIYPRVGTRAC